MTSVTATAQHTRATCTCSKCVWASLSVADDGMHGVCVVVPVGLLWWQACGAAGWELGNSGQHCRATNVQELVPEGAAACVCKVQAGVC